MVGACYQFGYWGSFHVNPLEFISITDVGKLAVYPLVVTFACILSGILIGKLLIITHYPPGAGADTPIGRKLNKHRTWLAASLILIAANVAIFFTRPEKWLVVAALIGPLSTGIGNLDSLIKVLPNAGMRYSILSVIVLLPIFSIYQGSRQAHDIKDNRPAQFVDVVRSKLPIESDEKHSVAYLGYLGNVYILREGKTGQLIFVKQRDDSPLFLSVTP